MIYYIYFNELKITHCFCHFQFTSIPPGIPFAISINRGLGAQDLPPEGLPGVTTITITVTTAEGYTTVTVSDLYVRACNEVGK